MCCTPYNIKNHATSIHWGRNYLGGVKTYGTAGQFPINLIYVLYDRSVPTHVLVHSPNSLTNLTKNLYI